MNNVLKMFSIEVPFGPCLGNSVGIVEDSKSCKLSYALLRIREQEFKGSADNKE